MQAQSLPRSCCERDPRSELPCCVQDRTEGPRIRRPHSVHGHRHPTDGSARESSRPCRTGAPRWLAQSASAVAQFPALASGVRGHFCQTGRVLDSSRSARTSLAGALAQASNLAQSVTGIETKRRLSRSVSRGFERPAPHEITEIGIGLLYWPVRPQPPAMRVRWH